MYPVILIALAASIVAGGCTAAPKEIYSANGRKGHVIDCSPKAKNLSRVLLAQGTPESRNAAATMPPPEPNWGACMGQAGNICGARGYDVLERHAGGSLIVQCKGR